MNKRRLREGLRIAPIALLCAVTLLLAAAVSTNANAQAALTFGPITGGVTDTTARVFLRTSASASVALQYSTDSSMSGSAISAVVATDPTNDYTTIIQMSGLQPETVYYLNVLVDGVYQISPPYPQFKTFAAPGSARNFRFVVLTDFADRRTQSIYQTYPSYRNAALENPDFVFLGGDMDHRGPLTLSGKFQMFKDLFNPQSIGNTDFVNKILRQFAIAHQWDDHDSGPDNVDKTYRDWNLAYQAFRAYVPMYDSPAPPGSYGIWQKFSYGQADFFIMDDRSQRNNEYDVDGANKSMLDGNHLGPTGQLAWLKDNLLSSQATWKILFSGLTTNPTTRMPDGWAGYQTEWNALRSFILRHHIKNVLFITGDLHYGGIDNGAASGFPEMMVGNVDIVTASGSPCSTGVVGAYSEGVYVNTSGSCRQYGVVTVMTNPDQVLLQIKDENANVKISYTLDAK